MVILIIRGEFKIMSSSKTSYVYHVELLIEDEHHAAALMQLMNKLNSAEFVDYKIISGIQLGNEIDARKVNAASATSVSVKKNQVQDEQRDMITSAAPFVGAAVKHEKTSLSLGLEAFRQCKAQNKLIRLIVNRGLGIKVSIPCRVINIDDQEMIITVYHVDEKQVYTFRLTEIEDFTEA